MSAPAFRYSIRPGQGVFQAPAHGAAGIGPRDDDEVLVELVAGVDGGAVLADSLVDRYYLLPGDEAAPLGRDLVLDVDSGDPGPDEGVDGAAYVDGVAVAGVGVGDQRDIDGLGHVPGIHHHFAAGEKAGVGEARQRA